ncbi:MAG: acetolactate synthase small subunit [Dehalococcoidia bacterium]|nr:acetolactate synthase small subunit [Dehalococcoidia bacterium]
MEADRVHTIVALLRDRPGVLNRVASVIRRRGFNISSLTVGNCETEGLSRMTFVVQGDDNIADQVTKQLRKLMDVVRIADISYESFISREMALIKVRANPATRGEIMQIVDIFRANIVDVSPEALVIEVTGDEDKVASLLGMVNHFGVCEVQRSGRLSMVRGMIGAGDSTAVVTRSPNGHIPEVAVEVDRSGG